MPGRSTRVLEGGRVLVGGSPVRLLRLGPGAAALAGAWLAGAPVHGTAKERALARRLLDAGLAHPRPPGPGPGPDQVTVVVPVRDRPRELGRLLAALGGLRVVVVDDGSLRPDLVEREVVGAGADLVALPRNAGPATASNTGLARATTPFVAFVDSDCTPPPGWLSPLLAHFDDPLVGAVAPRVVAAPGTGRAWLDAYEQARSPLDRGSAEGPVRPGSSVHFVPTAALVVRRHAVGARSFDEDLGAGEDVDFVWRLQAAGWSVRFEPSSEVLHDPRRGLRPWLGQRAGYGASAGPLARRHGGHLAPVVVPGWTAAVWALMLARRPRAALAVGALQTALLARRLRPVVHHAGREATILTASGSWRAARPLLGSLGRTYAPVALAAAATGRFRRAGLALLLAPAAVDWWATRPPLDPFRYALAHAADDVAYGAGLWAGCLRARTGRPLVPRVVLRRAAVPTPRS